MAEFKGIVPAFITPMTSDGELNEAAFREVMEFNIRSGVHGFWIAGGTGESILLSDEENNRIAEISADQNRGRVNNIMHVGAPTTARAARMAEYAARAGVEAICCVPPFFYPFTDDQIVEHYRTVAAAADLPLFVYNLPQATGVEITPELMQKIQDGVPQLAGLKHSSMDFGNVRAFVGMGLDCFVGNSKLMLPALTLGAVGCVDGPPCAAPELWVEVYDAYIAGDLKRAETAQDRASALAEIVVKHGFHSSVKILLGERLGIDCGAPRPPGSHITPDQKAWMIESAAAVGIGRVMASQSRD
jgi:dihydrodipicolinate synthase/N-acetylneuraminate lyase